MTISGDLNLEYRGVFDAARAALANAEGDSVGALAVAEPALRACLEHSYPVSMRLALIQAVDAAFALDDDAKVEELVGLVHQAFRPGAQPSVDAHVLRWRARLAEHHGQLDDSEKQFGLAIDAFTALQRPFWLAVTRLELAETLMRNRRTSSVEELLSQARSTFAELGASPWLDRAQGARQPSSCGGVRGPRLSSSEQAVWGDRAQPVASERHTSSLPRTVSMTESVNWSVSALPPRSAVRFHAGRSRTRSRTWRARRAAGRRWASSRAATRRPGSWPWDWPGSCPAGSGRCRGVPRP